MVVIGNQDGRPGWRRPSLTNFTNGQLLTIVTDSDLHDRARIDFRAGHHGRQRLCKLPVDGALQLASPVFLTDAASQEKIARFRQNFDGEAAFTEPRIDVALQPLDVVIE